MLVSDILTFLSFQSSISEHGIFRTDFSDRGICDQNGSKTNERLEKSCRHGTSEINGSGETAEYVCVNGLRSFKQGAVIHGDLIKQAEI